jgi:DNA-directed RNA polymerase subunit RPC12/RpoP
MEYQDKVLKCIDCGTDFVFTAGEQLFFHDKQFKNEPKRCKNCKGKRVAVLGSASHASSARTLLREDRDAHELFAVRQGDDGAVPSDAGAPGAVPRMLSAGAAGSRAPDCSFTDVGLSKFPGRWWDFSSRYAGVLRQRACCALEVPTNRDACLRGG